MGIIVRKKEMVAMILAGGQGSRLGVLTKKLAKPAGADSFRTEKTDSDYHKCPCKIRAGL